MMCEEWNFLNGIKILCEKYVAQDSLIEGWREPYEQDMIGSLNFHMAFIYRVTTDRAMCEILSITHKTSDPGHLEQAIHSWLVGSNHSSHKITNDGRHLYFSDISGSGPKWHPLPVMFREKWLDFLDKYRENTENYIDDFLYEYKLKSTD